MEQDRVPQDNISTYADNKKVMYATDRSGNYSIIASSGWEIEEEATLQAVREMKRLAREAYALAAKGERSPLFFHMYDRRMDLQVLAEATGLFKWRIKRHFRPAVFRKLPEKILLRYSDALGIPRQTLCNLPQQNKNL